MKQSYAACNSNKHGVTVGRTYSLRLGVDAASVSVSPCITSQYHDFREAASVVPAHKVF